jgi:hypothetical protein
MSDTEKLFAAIDDLRQRMTRIETLLEASNLAARLLAVEESVRKLENLEQRRLGGGAVVGAMLGVIGSVLMACFGWWLSRR